ncbi:MAG: hypothetical protein ABW022_11625 [Actinoplanes sp.]
MSVRDVSRDSVIAAVAAGYVSRATLATHFGVLLGPGRTLTTVIDVLIEDGLLREDDGRLHTIGHDLLENLEDQ